MVKYHLPFLVFLFFIMLLGCNKEENPVSSGAEGVQATLKGDTDTSINPLEKNKPELSREDLEKNHPPQVTSIKIVSISEDTPRKGFRALVEARDIDGDEVSFRYQWKRNGEIIPGAIDEVLEWQSGFKKGDTISIEVVPFDGKEEGIWVAEGSFVIPNSPPKIVSTPPTEIRGGKLTYKVEVEDPDGDPVEVKVNNAPPGLVIEPATRTIKWEIDESKAGEYVIEIVAEDKEGARAIQSITLKVSSENP